MMQKDMILKIIMDKQQYIMLVVLNGINIHYLKNHICKFNIFFYVLNNYLKHKLYII